MPRFAILASWFRLLAIFDCPSMASTCASQAASVKCTREDGRVRVTVDGEPTQSWVMDGDDLVLTLPGDAHEIRIETEIDPDTFPANCVYTFDEAITFRPTAR